MANLLRDYNIIRKIDDVYPKLSKSHKRIGDFVRDHYDRAVFMTAAALGREVDASESTVVRFANAIGYEGYPEFQKDLSDWVKNKLNSVQRVETRYGSSTQLEIVREVLGQDMVRIKNTLDQLNAETFELAVNTILEAEHVYIVGVRSCAPLAELLGFYLNMCRDNVKVLTTTSTSETFEQMIRVSEKDCVIGISFPRYSMRTLKAMEFANDRNAKVVTITDNIHSPMCMYSACNLYAVSEQVSIVDSLCAPLSLINALIVSFCIKRPAEVRSDLEMLEETWNNYQVYLNDEINFIKDSPVLKYSLKREEE